MKKLVTFLILVTICDGKIRSRKGLTISPEDGNAPLPKSRFIGPPPCEERINFNGTGQSATIQSPGFPFNYWPNLRCFYFVTSPPGTRIDLNCDDFNVEESANGQCDYDSFRFSLDGNLNSEHRMFSCGRGSIRQVSVNNQLTIFFSSDNANVRSIYPFRFLCTLKVIGKPIVPTPNPVTPKPILPPTPSTCSCGERKLKKEIRIVGGTKAELNEFPWTCSLFNNQYGYFCGCTIINENWILTAAHCSTAVAYATNVEVNIGDHDLSRPDEADSELVPVSKLIIHPQYDPNTQDNDLSLLKLEKKLTFKDNVQPICLPFKFVEKSLHGVDTVATGWGLDEYGGKQKVILQKVNLTIMETRECRDFAEYSQELLTDNMFCTYADGKQRDMCQGDSGGGINIYDEASERFFEVGISSWGIGCAMEMKPGAYAKLTLKKYLDWIQTHTGPELCIVT